MQKATRESVFAAAEAIVAAGAQPTLMAIRQAVGGGSFSTIQPLLAEWRAEREALAKASSPPIPELLAEHALKLGAVIWAQATILAREELERGQAKLHAAMEDVEILRVESANLSDQLLRDLDASKEECSRLSIELQRAIQEVTASRSELVAANAMLVESSNRADDASAACRKERESGTLAMKEAAELRGQLRQLETQNAALLATLAQGQD